MLLEWSGKLARLHVSPWEPAMSVCDLGGAQTLTHCRLGHVHGVVNFLSPAEAHIALYLYSTSSFLPGFSGLLLLVGMREVGV